MIASVTSSSELAELNNRSQSVQSKAARSSSVDSSVHAYRCLVTGRLLFNLMTCCLKWRKKWNVSDVEYKANNHLLVSGDGKLSLPRRSECIRYLSSASLRKDSYIQIASEVIVCPITFTNGNYLLIISFIILSYFIQPFLFFNTLVFFFFFFFFFLLSFFLFFFFVSWVFLLLAIFLFFFFSQFKTEKCDMSISLHLNRAWLLLFLKKWYSDVVNYIFYVCILTLHIGLKLFLNNWFTSLWLHYFFCLRFLNTAFISLWSSSYPHHSRNKLGFQQLN